MFAPQSLWGAIVIVPQTMMPDDLLRLPDDGSKNELFEGVLIKAERIGTLHGAIRHRLSGAISLYAMNTSLPNYIVVNALFDMTLPGITRKTVLAPDLAILKPSAQLARNVTTDIPLLAIEVVSPSQTLAELGIKARFYRNAGVAEVWLIEPQTRIVEIWQGQGTTTLNDTQILTSALLPGFSVAVQYLLDGV